MTGNEFVALSEARKLEAKRMAEAEQWGSIVDTREYLTDDPSFGLGKIATVYTSIDDRSDGKLWPIYRCEQDLAYIRMCSRRLAEVSGKYVGAQEALANYVLGSGFEFEATCQHAPQLATMLQAFIGELLGRWHFVGGLDREILDRSREDGESLVALEFDPEGWPCPLVIEPDCLTEPAKTRQIEDWLSDCDNPQSWSFGVRTLSRNTSNVLGYHVVFDSGGSHWEYYPESRLQHIKRNVPRNAKRGVSDWLPVGGDVLREAKLGRNMVEGAALQAAIAWILQSPAGMTSANTLSIGPGGASGSFQRVTNGGGSQTTYTRNYPPGTILTPTAGLEYVAGPMGSERNAGFELVGQYILRSIGVRWNMPEYMISGDASNANYSSSLVAESPFVKARETDQRFYAEHFKRLLWKALRMLWESGRLTIPCGWDHFRKMVEIKVDCPAVASRDAKAQADAAAVYVGMGAMSVRTAATEAGYDYDEELAAGAKKEELPPMIAPTGGPGLPVASGAPVQQQPKTAIQAAVETALQSVSSTEEAKVILEQLKE